MAGASSGGVTHLARGLVSQIPWAAVEPECPGLYGGDPQQPGQCPGILGKACPDLVLIGGCHDMQGLFAITDRAAEDDEAIIDQPVHEGRVLIPGVLIPVLTRAGPSLRRGPAAPRS